jgi:ribonuclease G
VYSAATTVRSIERSLTRVGAEGKEKRIVVRMHPEVALQILEQETDFLPTVRKRTRLKVELLDDPLMRQDTFRLLAGPAETDVTERFVPGVES